MDYSDQLITFLSREVSPQQENTTSKKESCNVTTVPESERFVQIVVDDSEEQKGFENNEIDISSSKEDSQYLQNLQNLPSSQK